jgi:hypothetical protein
MVVPLLWDHGTVDSSDHRSGWWEEHGDQHPDEDYEAQHRDEDLDEILQNLTGPIQSEPPSDKRPLIRRSGASSENPTYR